MKLYEVRNDTGRRFHVGTDEKEAIEVATRLEAQQRGVAPAGAVGGPTPLIRDLPSYVVVTVQAPDREAVAQAVEEGVRLPGSPTGSQVTGNEVAERKAAETRDALDALGPEPEDTTVDERTTSLEPRPSEVGDDLENRTIEDLYSIASREGIEAPSKAKKAALVKLIRDGRNTPAAA